MSDFLAFRHSSMLTRLLATVFDFREQVVLTRQCGLSRRTIAQFSRQCLISGDPFSSQMWIMSDFGRPILFEMLHFEIILILSCYPLRTPSLPHRRNPCWAAARTFCRCRFRSCEEWRSWSVSASRSFDFSPAEINAARCIVRSASWRWGWRSTSLRTAPNS